MEAYLEGVVLSLILVEELSCQEGELEEYLLQDLIDQKKLRVNQL